MVNSRCYIRKKDNAYPPCILPVRHSPEGDGGSLSKDRVIGLVFRDFICVAGQVFLIFHIKHVPKNYFSSGPSTGFQPSHKASADTAGARHKPGEAAGEEGRKPGEAHKGDEREVGVIFFS